MGVFQYHGHQSHWPEFKSQACQFLDITLNWDAIFISLNLYFVIQALGRCIEPSLFRNRNVFNGAVAPKLISTF